LGSAEVKGFFHPVVCVSMLVALAMAAFVWLLPPDHTLAEVESLANYQMADAPLAMPEGGVPGHELHLLSAWERVAMPRARRMDFPLGSAAGALTYNAQAFWEMNEARGGHHTGDDLNGIGGMNTDLGDPVWAIADGTVLYAGEPSHGWGKVVVVGHRVDGRILHSMYAHLDRIKVAVGQVLGRGDRIGSVGTANDSYPAHLHFEIREGPGIDMGVGYTMVPGNRLDPSATVRDGRGADPAERRPSLLPVALGRDDPWNRLELSPENAARLGEILGRE
jgi:hypothetical protein